MADNVVSMPVRPRLAIANAGDGQPPLADRLAALLSEIIDEPLVTLPGHVADGPQPLSLRLGHFTPDLSERAAALLEEAGW